MDNLNKTTESGSPDLMYGAVVGLETANQDLRGMTFDKVHFSGCTFRRCDLRRVSFGQSRFTNCTFEMCDLGCADLSMSFFDDCKFYRSDLSGASIDLNGLSNTSLSETKCYHCDVVGIRSDVGAESKDADASLDPLNVFTPLNIGAVVQLIDVHRNDETRHWELADQRIADELKRKNKAREIRRNMF